MRYGDLTYIEIRELADAGCLAVVPAGCIAQQGLHLPVDYDAWFAEALCLAASRRAQKRHQVVSLVLPTLPFGPTPAHRSAGSGDVHLPQPLHEAVLRAVLEALAGQGFQRILLWQGCGQHSLDDMVHRFNREHGGQSQALLPARPLQDIWRRAGEACALCGQAALAATSVALYLRPEAVRSALMRNANCTAGDDAPDPDAAAGASTSEGGVANEASPELGKRLWEAMVDDVSLFLKEAAEA